MRLLADTNVFVKFVFNGPLADEINSTINDQQTERCLSPISIVEIYRLWQKGEIADHPDSWLSLALPSWTILPVTVPIARQSVLWPWQHRDPADRIIAATADVEKIELWHTDTVLKKLTGFPGRYFKNVI
jgi:PIN domain nuclease of toxin-antitoxin system